MVSECSQLNRSGPVTVTTPRWDRSTRAVPVEVALLAHRVAVVPNRTLVWSFCHLNAHLSRVGPRRDRVLLDLDHWAFWRAFGG